MPDWVPADAWADFAEMRKAIRKPMTKRAQQLLVGALIKLRADGHEPCAVLEQSIANSWQGLFPIKAEQRTKRRPVLSADEVFEGAR